MLENENIPPGCVLYELAYNIAHKINITPNVRRQSRDFILPAVAYANELLITS